MRLNREWRVHIGVHKTATTHLQESLAAVHTELRDLGVFYFSTPITRRLLSQPLNQSLVSDDLDALAQQARGHLNRYAHGRLSYLLSEENIPGPSEDALHPTLYPHMERRLQLIRTLASTGSLRIFVSLRSLESLLPGAYTTALRFASVEVSDRRCYEERLGGRCPSWFEFMKRVVAIVPAERVSVWRYEDYFRHRQHIAEHLVGQSLPELPELPRPRESMRPSTGAVLQAEERMAARKPRDIRAWRQEVDALYADDAGTADATRPEKEKFNFLSEDLRQRLREQYDEDCRRIANAWPAMLLRYPTPEQ